jgi:phosphoglycolate phosphatase
LIRICIFDLDGTTVNSLKSIAHFANETLAAFNLQPFETDEYRTLAGGGAKKLITNLINARGADISLLDSMVEDWLSRYEQNAFYLTEPYDGITRMLSDLKSMGIITAIVTNKSQRVAKTIIENSFGAPGELIDTAITEHPGMVLKPNPDEILNLCQVYGISTKEAMYVGDHTIDMTTGKNAGVFSCGVTWGFHKAEDLIFAGADFIANKPQDIVDIIKNIT